MDINEKDKDLSTIDNNSEANKDSGAKSAVTTEAMADAASKASAPADGGIRLEPLAEGEGADNSSRAELEVEENKIQIISPGRMVLKRFFRSRLSVIGLVTLVVLFAFSIFGPLFSSWGETTPDLRPTPIFGIDYPIPYTEKIETDEGILIAAELALSSGFEKILPEDSETQRQEKIANNKRKLFEEYEGEVASFKLDGKDIYFEAIEEQGEYTFYLLEPNPEKKGTYNYIVTNMVRRNYSSRTINLNDVPTKDHWLGTDASAYDVFTRLMYAGRISLTLGFVVVFITAFIGIVLGGIAGYFGKWIDLIIMRIIDIIYCLPSLPIMLIFSAILDGIEIDESLRIYFLMALLSLLGWAGVARTVRGQILALREQEFMVAAEALGISIPRRIARHLVPNIMPILIVSMTLALGSTILTEATLSFLGLGIRPPKAAWGTMISSANDPLILQYYPNQWVPAGVMIVLAVLAFNFVGDGLRDAFDPKMKR